MGIVGKDAVHEERIRERVSVTGPAVSDHVGDIVQGAGQDSAGPGNPNGADYRWGYLFGENFDRCAWINNNAVDADTTKHGANDCGNPQEIDTRLFLATYTEWSSSACFMVRRSAGWRNAFLARRSSAQIFFRCSPIGLGARG